MYKIDELITEIYADEAIDVPGELTKEQKKRIEAYVETMMMAEEETKQKAYEKPESIDININRKNSFRYRKKAAIILAAALILILGMTAFAARQNEWDITLMNFMGLNENSVLQLEGGEVVIEEVTTSTWTDYAEDKDGEEKQISITGITSIGDKNSAYLRVNTDYVLPEEFDETTDYILPENHRMDITYNNIFGHEEIRTFGSAFTAFYEDGKLGFLISIESCEDVNKCSINLKIENLYWYHDLGQHEEVPGTEPEELLAEGVWEKEWKFSYKSNVRTEHCMKKLDSDEGTIYLTQIEISPISIRMEAVRNPKDRELPWNTDMLEEIQYEDGTTVRVNTMGTGGIKNGIFIEEFTNMYYLDEVLEPEKVKSIKVCGQNIDI